MSTAPITLTGPERDDLAGPLRELYGRDLIRFLLQRLVPVVERIATTRVIQARAQLVAAVEDIAADLGHPTGCDCGDELDRFTEAMVDVAGPAEVTVEWGIAYPGQAPIGPLEEDAAREHAGAGEAQLLQRIGYVTAWHPVD